MRSGFQPQRLGRADFWFGMVLCRCSNCLYWRIVGVGKFDVYGLRRHQESSAQAGYVARAHVVDIVKRSERLVGFPSFPTIPWLRGLVKHFDRVASFVSIAALRVMLSQSRVGQRRQTASQRVALVRWSACYRCQRHFVITLQTRKEELITKKISCPEPLWTLQSTPNVLLLPRSF